MDMSVPNWATVIGALCILFGLIGVASAVKDISAPSAQSQFNQAVSYVRQGKLPNGESLGDIEYEIEWDGEGKPPDIEELLEQLQENFQEPPWEVEIDGHTVTLQPTKALDFLALQLQYPPWYLKWAPLIAWLSLMIATVYLLTGILLSLGKPIAIKLAYAVFGLSIMGSGILVAAYSQADSGILFTHVPGRMGSIIVDVLFLAIILGADKSAFSRHTDLTLA
jgi:hypothetical protein